MSDDATTRCCYAADPNAHAICCFSFVVLDFYAPAAGSLGPVSVVLLRSYRDMMHMALTERLCE